MHAFGLEESSRYAEAEAAGRRALAADARVPWAIHAVAHVMEMQGRHDEGTQWLRRAARPSWATRQRLCRPPRLAPGAVRARGARPRGSARAATTSTSTAAARGSPCSALDAASLLWRLRLLGADVGDALARARRGWQLDDAAGHYAFNDLHALMALVGAGDAGVREALGARRARRAPGRARRWRQPRDRARGRRAADARPARLRGRAVATTPSRRSPPVRSVAHRFGGSHAQRDLIDQTLLAACASGRGTAARPRAAQRAAARQAGDETHGALGRPARPWLNRRPSRCRPT